MKKKLIFVYNPMSGTGKIRRFSRRIHKIFVDNGYDAKIYRTLKGHNVARKIEKHGEKFDIIVCSGGDGTLSQVANGVMTFRKPVDIGYIPTGSTNDFGKTLGLPSNVLKCANRIAAGSVSPVDIGQFNNRYFVYVAAFGMFSDISYSTGQVFKNVLGHNAYILSAIKSFADIPDVDLRIDVDGRTVRDKFLYGMITNSRRVAGIEGIIPGDIDLSDGLFEVTLVRSPRNPSQLADIIAFLTNMSKKTDMVYTFQAKNIVIRSPKRLAWTLDGEFGGKIKTAVITNHHKKLRLLT